MPAKALAILKVFSTGCDIYIYVSVAICGGHIWAINGQINPFFQQMSRALRGFHSQKPQTLKNTADKHICEDPDVQILLKYL